MIDLGLVVALTLCGDPGLPPRPVDDPPWAREVGPGGEPLSEGLRIDGLLEGTFAAWHGTGFLADLGDFRHDRAVGTSQAWDEAGRLAFEGGWVNGLPEGTWRFFHVNGEVASEGSYVAGYRQGPWAERFADGTLFRVTEWVDGESERDEVEQHCVDNDGEYLVDLDQRVEGCRDELQRRTGLWRGYHPTGALAWERTYSAGLLDDEGFDYHSSGALLHHGAYRVGGPDGLHVWTAADGSLLGTAELVEGTGPWRDLWPDGSPKEEGAWVAFRKDGAWRAWDERGVLVAEVLWDHGERVSERLMDGGVVVAGDFVDGLRDGLWSARDGDGARVWEGRYLAGERVGTWHVSRVERRNVAGRRAGGGVVAAAGPELCEVTFEGDGELARVTFWPSGAVREVAAAERRVRAWADGIVLRDDALVEGVAVVDPDEDAESAWLAARELQAWLLSDPFPSALVDATAAPTDERSSEVVDTAPRPREPEPRDAPPAVGEVDDQGQPTGLWTYFGEDGGKTEQGSFVGGVREGLWRGFGPGERVRWEAHYVHDVLDGLWRGFHGDGSLALVGELRRGVRVGTWTWYHRGGGPATVGAYRDGAADGPWRGFHPSGLTAWTGAYAVGRRVGTWTFWRADGTLWRVTPYEDGREQR